MKIYSCYINKSIMFVNVYNSKLYYSCILTIHYFEMIPIINYVSNKIYYQTITQLKLYNNYFSVQLKMLLDN